MTINTDRQFNISNIYACDVNTMKAPADKISLGLMIDRIWVRLLDMFCSTNRVEAKKCLSDLYSINTTDAQKIDLFQQLKDMAGDGCQNQFVHENTDDRESYIIRLADNTECFSLTFDKLSLDKASMLETILTPPSAGQKTLIQTFEGDVGRGTYYVGGELSDGDDKTRIAQITEKLTLMGCTDKQQIAIKSVAHQGTFAPINTQETALTGFCRTSPNSKPIVRYDIKAGIDGRVHVQGQSIKDISNTDEERKLQNSIDLLSELPEFVKSINISFDIAIDQDGKVDILQLGYKYRKNP